MVRVMTSRSEAEYGSSDVIQPLLRPRLMTSVVIPILSYRPFIAILPEMTPIEPVSVPGSAKIFVQPIEM